MFFFGVSRGLRAILPGGSVGARFPSGGGESVGTGGVGAARSAAGRGVVAGWAPRRPAFRGSPCGHPRDGGRSRARSTLFRTARSGRRTGGPGRAPSARRRSAGTPPASRRRERCRSQPWAGSVPERGRGRGRAGRPSRRARRLPSPRGGHGDRRRPERRRRGRRGGRRRSSRRWRRSLGRSPPGAVPSGRRGDRRRRRSASRCGRRAALPPCDGRWTAASPMRTTRPTPSRCAAAKTL